MDKDRSEFEIINQTVTKLSLTNLDYKVTELNFHKKEQNSYLRSKPKFQS